MKVLLIFPNAGPSHGQPIDGPWMSSATRNWPDGWPPPRPGDSILMAGQPVPFVTMTVTWHIDGTPRLDAHQDPDWKVGDTGEPYVSVSLMPAWMPDGDPMVGYHPNG